jgi:hypothetical protein
MSERLKSLKVKLKAAMLDRRLKMRHLNSVRKAFDRAARLVDELEQKIEIELAKPEREHK